MIVFLPAPAPVARPGEAEIGGRRIAGRLLPYGGEAGADPLRFDPVARRFVRRRPDATVAVGPASPEAWRKAAARLPPGPVLVGPGAVAETVRGAYRAAAEGALSAGRAVFLLDPEPDGIPDCGADVVVLCSFAPGRASSFPRLAAAGSRGPARGVLFPLVPGWTAESDALEALLSEASAGGARFATALIPETDGESRRAIVEAKAAIEPDAAGGFFESIHHGEWAPRMLERLAELRERCAAHGLAVLPPRPVGRREPAANAAASARLEELADRPALPEHRAALLRAAVRWIDESGRDLAAVAREGNFRRVFPFDVEVAAEVEAAMGEAR
jgi:hypothetical protein